MKKIHGKILAFFIGLIVVLALAEFSLRLIGNYGDLNKQTQSRDSEKYQIMTIGNSYTAGVGAPEGESYSNFLEKFLNEDGKKSYRVINRGIVNANSSFLREQLEGWINLDFPNYALLMVGEPNYWNTYNYASFLNEDKKDNSVSRIVESLKKLKIYRLFELLEYQATENFEVFKNIPRDEKNRKFLGYNYLAAFDYSIVLNVRQISEKMREEAIWSLEGVYKEDDSQSVARILASLYIQKKDYQKAVNLLDSAIKKMNLFDYNTYLLLKETSFPESLDVKIKDLEEQLKQKKMLIPLEEMVEIDKAKSFFIDKSDGEKAKRLYLYYQHSPNIGELAGFLSKYFVNVSGKHFYEIIKTTIENNPLTMAYDSHAHINIVREKYPQFNNQVDELIEKVEKKIGQNPFKSSRGTNQKTKEQWVLYDLELMIKRLRANGSIVIVQTYPPMRSEMVRPVDNVIRWWWRTRQKEEGVYFQDLNMILREKFDDRTPEGRKFYSSEWGNKDPHQSSLGNIELAREMSSFILEIQSPKN